MEYDHAHADSDIFKTGSEWRSKVQTLGDYVRQKAPWPCVVVGAKPLEETNGTERSD
jgi:hypothetical protein